jgi:hypothetical protein
MLRDMDPERKRALIVRAVQLVAFLMLILGWAFILIFWNN